MLKTPIWTLVRGALLMSFLTGCGGTPASSLTPISLYEGDPDYEELTEPQSPWYGTLEEAAGVYVLSFGDEEQALFTKDTEARLDPFVDHKVIVTGKLASAEADSALWPAKVELHENGLLACSALIPQKPVEEKIHSYLANLIAEQPGEQVERVSISFCEDQTITPEST